ncbi:MAG: PHP domain-containing protein [Candidatus Hodarchaeales archaeon]
MLIDTHIHTSAGSLDSNLTVRSIVKNIHPKIGAIVITDHDYFPENYKTTTVHGIQVLFGVEITTSQGHLLAYGIEELPSKILDVREVIDIVHDQDGIAIAAHPFRDYLSLGELVHDFSLKIDGLEINGKSPKNNWKLVKGVAATRNLPVIGGSDAHQVNDLNTRVSHCTSDVNCIDDLVSLIKHKKVYPRGIF